MMNKLIGVYKYLTIWGYALTKEVVSRLLSIVFYPIAYLMRDKLRKHLYSIDEAFIKDRTFGEAEMAIPEDFDTKVNKFYFFLWMFLDDSPAKDNKHEDGTPMYDASDTDRYYPKWIVATKWFWLRAVWWSFIRNNSVNYVSYYRTAGWKEVQTTYWGEYNINIDKNDQNTIYKPGMYLVDMLHNDGNVYPYFTFIGEVFGRKVGIWQGRSSGSGRFSFSIRM